MDILKARKIWIDIPKMQKTTDAQVSISGLVFYMGVLLLAISAKTINNNSWRKKIINNKTKFE